MPGTAMAQRIPTEIALAAVSPLLVIALALVLGWLTHSWRTALRHSGLVICWILLTGIFAYWVENDAIIWTPVGIYVVHSLLIIVLVIRELARRARGERASG